MMDNQSEEMKQLVK